MPIVHYRRPQDASKQHYLAYYTISTINRSMARYCAIRADVKIRRNIAHITKIAYNKVKSGVYSKKRLFSK